VATQASGSLDFETLRRAIEDRDADTLIGFYAEDAEVRTVNKNDTPSSPRVLRGKEEISEYLRDVYDRGMTHRVEGIAITEGGRFFYVTDEDEGVHLRLTRLLAD
jgi:ketosteroid isomerase-like protein